jgi:hypothetical protein
MLCFEEMSESCGGFSNFTGFYSILTLRILQKFVGYRAIEDFDI